MDMAEQGDIEHTLVMSDTSGTETGSKSGSLRSDISVRLSVPAMISVLAVVSFFCDRPAY
jgi:hypothetical protein